MPKKKATVKKVSLTDLLGREGKSNAELHKDNEAKRAKHLIHRTPRHRLINCKGMDYTRPLAGDAAWDERYNELAREFVNNGFCQTRAYAAVFGKSIKNSRGNSSRIFNSSWMRSKIREITLGVDGEGVDDLPKEYLIERLMQMIDANILDYMDDDGKGLNIVELKALPSWTQLIIKRLNVVTTTVPVAVKDEAGNVIMDADGQPAHVEVTNQSISIELYDKLKAMEIMAKAMKWITSDTTNTFNFIGADTMVQAEARVTKYGRKEIEGKAERVAAD
jgi:hypothetical protein